MEEQVFVLPRADEPETLVGQLFDRAFGHSCVSRKDGLEGRRTAYDCRQDAFRWFKESIRCRAITQTAWLAMLETGSPPGKVDRHAPGGWLDARSERTKELAKPALYVRRKTATLRQYGQINLENLLDFRAKPAPQRDCRCVLSSGNPPSKRLLTNRTTNPQKHARTRSW